MTTDEWMKYAKDNQNKLINLIGNYHPVNIQNIVGMRITAPNAEAACERVRQNIRRNFEGNPVTQFTNALEKNDVSIIYKLLNDSWFGVPESTSCWSIDGFREAVFLMDDPPED